MRTLCSRKWGIGLILILPFFITACVNHFLEDGESTTDNNNIPLRFTADIHKVVKTRISDNTFDQDDAVGLFALAGSTTLTEERYADNLLFINSEDGIFETEEAIYYPEDGITLDLISYYPYKENGIDIGESKMQVSIETDQSISANYSHSDFLVGRLEKQYASKETLIMPYKHKFSRLNIVIVPGVGEDVKELLAANPQLVINGYYTKATYDFQKDSYAGYIQEKGVIPAGTWREEGGKLIGKKAILIPQKMTAGYQYITLEIKGKHYLCWLPSTLELQSGKQRDIEITFVAVEDVLIGSVNSEIDPWEGNEIDQAELEVTHKYIDVSNLNFEQSNVYKVLNAGQQVAEICKEYLATSGLSSQAIVAYPMKTDHTVDLTKGIVVQLLGNSEKVHGGNVSSDTEKHFLTYTPGTLAIRNCLYVLADGQISLFASMKDELLSVITLADVFRDTRGETIHYYPIVKIGTQYWMRSNLEATKYIDGNDIPELSDMVEGATGYLSNDGSYFYAPNVVLTNKLLPVDWKVPTWEDWNLLKDYLKNASLLKSGEWRALTSKDPIVTEVNNRSGFNALPVGIWYAGGEIANYVGRYLGYWTLEDSGAIPETFFILKSNSDEFSSGNTGTDKACVLRALRK